MLGWHIVAAGKENQELIIKTSCGGTASAA